MPINQNKQTRTHAVGNRSNVAREASKEPHMHFTIMSTVRGVNEQTLHVKNWLHTANVMQLVLAETKPLHVFLTAC